MAFEQTKKIVDKAKGVLTQRPAITENETFRQDLIKVNAQLSSTRSIITNNFKLLQEVAKDDDGLKDVLKDFIDDVAGAKGIQEKILNRDKVDTKEAARLVDTLEKVTSTLSKLGVSLDINLSNITVNTKELVTDSRVDIKTRRDTIKEFTEFISKQDIDSKGISDLKKISIENLNFTKEETTNLNQILNQIQKDAKGKQIKSTLDNLNKSFDSAVLTEDEQKNLLQKQTSTFETFGEKFKKVPELFSQGSGDIKTGAITTGLDAILPGLGSFTETFGVTSKLGEVFSVKGVKGLLGSLKQLPKEIKQTTLKTISKAKDITGGFSKNGTTEKKVEKRSKIKQIIAQKSELKSTKKLTKSIDKLTKKVGKSGTGSKGGLGLLAGLGLAKLGGIAKGGLGLVSKVGGVGLGVAGKVGGLGLGVAGKALGGLGSLVGGGALTAGAGVLAAGAAGFGVGTLIDRTITGKIADKAFLKREQKQRDKLGISKAITKTELEEAQLKRFKGQGFSEEESLKKIEANKERKRLLKNIEAKNIEVKSKEDIIKSLSPENIEAKNIEAKNIEVKSKEEIIKSLSPEQILKVKRTTQQAEIKQTNSIPIQFDNRTRDVEINRSISNVQTAKNEAQSLRQTVTASGALSVQTSNQNVGIDRKLQIDDFGLAFMNSVLFG